MHVREVWDVHLMAHEEEMGLAISYQWELARDED